MTILVDPPPITKGQGPRQPPPSPPSQLPPSYAEPTAIQPLVGLAGPSPSVVPLNTHAGYGPTPINQQQQVALPYYDPRSVHSLQAANRRARERFIGALLWAMVIFALLPMFAWVCTRIRFGWSVSRLASSPWAGPHEPPDWMSVNA